MRRRHTGWLIMTIAAAASLAVVAALSETDSPQAGSPLEEQQRRASAENSAVVASLNRLERSMSAIFERVAALEDERRAAALDQHRKEETPETEQASSTENGSDDSPEQQALERAAIREEAMERLDMIDESFGAEVREEGWAREMQGKLETTFREGAFPGTKLLSTDCRSTLCRMEVSHENRENELQFELIRRQLRGNFYMQHSEPDDAQRSRTVVFFVREGRERDNVIQTLMMNSRG